MGLRFVDRVQETSTTTGTGNIALGGAVTGFQSFNSALSNGDTCYYCIADPTTGDWEVGLGTFISPSTLSRTTVQTSSNSGSAVSLSSNSKNVFVTVSGAALASFGGALYETYANRGNLRSLDGSGTAVVDGLGLFVWVAGSGAPDDDESCFVTASGAWQLEAVSWDYAYANWLPDFEVLNSKIAALIGGVFRGSFTMSLTSLAATTSSSFSVTVPGAVTGNSVVVNPGDTFGTSTTDQSRLSYVAYVSALNTVTVTIRNASAASATMTSSQWAVMVMQ